MRGAAPRTLAGPRALCRVWCSLHNTFQFDRSSDTTVGPQRFRALEPPQKTEISHQFFLAPRLLYGGMSERFGGPARRSGVPLEHSTHQRCLPSGAGRVSDLPVLPCTGVIKRRQYVGCREASESRARGWRGGNFLRTTTTQARVGGGHLHPVEQNHGGDVDP